MKNGEVIREALLNNTIRLIGEGGFEKATTRAIAKDGIDVPGIKFNEVHIYRLFGSQEQLYAEAFATLDRELFDRLGEVFRLLADRKEEDGRARLRAAFDLIWRFLLQNESRCRCYVRYYYSVYFAGPSLRSHRKLLSDYRVLFAPLFKGESDVISLMHTTFMTLMDFAIRVYNRDLQDNEENAYHIFLLIYTSLTPYLRPEFL